MDIQTIIVGVIFLVAAIYAGSLLLGKLRAFSVKTGQCSDDCGCGPRDRKVRPR